MTAILEAAQGIPPEVDALKRRVMQADRPFGVIGASPGGFGTILAQNGWLPVLRTLGTRT
jgi:NAD(P)H-dependent FMN reductase